MRYTHRTAGSIAKRLGDRPVNVMILRAKGFHAHPSFYELKGWLKPLKNSPKKQEPQPEPQDTEPAAPVSDAALVRVSKRIHEWAEDFGVESGAVLSAAQAEGIPVKSHMSSLTADEAKAIRSILLAGEGESE